MSTGTPTDRPSPPPAPGADQPPTRRRGLGSVRSMVISTVIVVLAVIGWWAFVPRSDQPAAPVADIAGIAREVGIAQHWDPAVADGLPKGWQPVNVRLVTAEHLPPTWQAGYDVSGGKYIRVLQTEDTSDDWVNTQTGDGAAQGTVTIDGVKWAKTERSDGGERSLVRSTPLGGLATVVDGTGDWSQLTRFAKALKPLSRSSLATKGPTAAG
ncbi:DUF4245 family protein [Flexivirga oryzae]|uniref:DUF4245 domain-containing protein n=1 Tax=Flexivirga oryzae TaxID=1794944 RepID=A0A839NI70_9MICO|nr:hypothetical protein [Flexivirga oryzae]